MARHLIPNSTQIPDVILDRWMSELSGTEFKVLMYIARRTYGFGKESDAISLSQIAGGMTRRDGTVLDTGTGASRAGVANALKELEEKGLIIRQSNRRESTGEYEENTYRINLGWQPDEAPDDESSGGGSGGGSREKGVVKKLDYPPSKSSRGWSKNSTRVVQKEDQGWSKKETTVVQKVDPQETDLQETDQETAASPADAAELLVSALVSHGVGRTVAVRLAGEKPEVCRRALEYLPFAKVKTTPGAWLAHAIEHEYGPPEAYLRAKSVAERRTTAATAKRKPVPEPSGLSRWEEPYTRLSESNPEALKAFAEHLATDRVRSEKIAAKLSPERREEYLARLDTEEHRLEVFGRWVGGEGKRFLREAGRTPSRIADSSG